MREGPFYHFSVDDVLEALIEVTDRGGGVLQHPTFAYLARLHERFGTRVDLYLFLEAEIAGRRRRLTEVPTALRDEFEALEWLSFGPHALDYAHAPYAQNPAEVRAMVDAIFVEIDRFAGPARRSKWIRFHYFSEVYELGPALREHGVEAVFLTDKPAISYRLPKELLPELRLRGHGGYRGLRWVSSHCRLESLVRDGLDKAAVPGYLDRILSRVGFLILFTHELDLADLAVREMGVTCLDTLAARRVPALEHDCLPVDSVPVTSKRLTDSRPFALAGRV